MKKIINQISIKDMILGDEIYVPKYQRAYSWEVAKKDEKRKKQVDLFLEDIINHSGNSKFYLGGFLYEEVQEDEKNPLKKYAIIDGQQRLTTIIILLSVLEKKLGEEKFEKIVNFKFKDIKFSTVDYDDYELKKYIICREGVFPTIYHTLSIKRIFQAFKYFDEKLENEEKSKSEKILKTLIEAKCSIDIVNSKTEATQIFIFENNRGKNPTNLELVKTKFIHFIYTNFEKEKQDRLLKEIDNQLGNIYKNIAQLENYINEDTVLAIATRIFKKNLKIDGVLIEIDNFFDNLKTEQENKENEIENFFTNLNSTFEKVKDFILIGLDNNISSSNYLNDREYSYLAESLINLGISVQIYPIIIKALIDNTTLEDMKRLLKNLEKILLRHLFIKTKADLAQRLNYVFKDLFIEDKKEETTSTKSLKSINDISKLIEKILTTDDKSEKVNFSEGDWWWYKYWSKENFYKELKNGLNALHASKYLLWQYENFLRREDNRLKYADIKEHQVEHIAPQTENKNSGYQDYEENFEYNGIKLTTDEIINSFGNLMLLSEKTNKSIQNNPLKEKLKNYQNEYDEKPNLLQQKEVIDKIQENKIYWSGKDIEEREEKILSFIKANY